MASSWVPTAPQDTRVLDLQTVKPWPGKPWPQQRQPPPQPIPPFRKPRSGAWTDAIAKAAKILSLNPKRVRPNYNAKSGKLPVRYDEPDSSFVLAELVRKVHSMQQRPLPDRRDNSLVERTLLELLHAVVDDGCKEKCGMNVPTLYKAGTEKEDLKIIRAAIVSIEEPALCNNAMVAAQVRKCKFDAERVEDGSPQKKLNGGPWSASQHRDDEMTGAIQPSPQRKRDPLDFGNRIEQALLKMDKWADAWLSGAMPQTDLAWDSFEFCLCMPDVLEDGEIKE